MQKVGVYYRKNKIVMCSLLQAISGYWFMSSSLLVVNDFSGQEIYCALMSSLSESRQNVPDPMELRSSQKKLLASIGVKSNKKIYEECQYLMIDQDNQLIHFLPTKNLGDKEGYEEILAKKISVPRDSDVSEIIKNFKLALSYCE